MELASSRCSLLFGGSERKATHVLNYMQVQEVLRGLGYIKDAHPEDEKNLVERMWKALVEPKEKRQVPVKDLQVFLEAVQGVLVMREQRPPPFAELFPPNEAKVEENAGALGHLDEDGEF